MAADPCGHYLGSEARHCQSTAGVRLYLPGPRCPQHTPSALKGQPDPHTFIQERKQAVSWIGKPMAAFDVETTGVDVENDRIVSASVILIDGPTRIEHTWIINPGIVIPEAASKIHGITDERAAAEGDAPWDAISEIVANLAHALGNDRPIITMNGVFDLTILDRECRRHSVPALSDQFDEVAPIIDVRVLDLHVDKYRKGSRTLLSLAEHYSVELTEAHDASADALAAARIAFKIGKWHPFIGNADADTLHRQQIGWRAEQMASFAAYRRKRGNPLDNEDGSWPILPLPGATA